MKNRNTQPFDEGVAGPLTGDVVMQNTDNIVSGAVDSTLQDRTGRRVRCGTCNDKTGGCVDCKPLG